MKSRSYLWWIGTICRSNLRKDKKSKEEEKEKRRGMKGTMHPNRSSNGHEFSKITHKED